MSTNGKIFGISGKTWGWLAPTGFVIVFAAGLWANRGVPPSVKPRWTAQSIIDRTSQNFEKVRYYKPRTTESPDMEVTFAPLIVDQLYESKLIPPQKIRAAPFDPPKYDATGLLLIGEPTVYFGRSEVTFGSEHLDQIIFIWWYQQFAECLPREPWAVPRGVRIIIGMDGLPLIWEAFSDEYSPRVFFVSQSLEQAAYNEFGEPLPGRHFAIERSIEDAPSVVVARVLDDGPVAMGPYVYVNSSSQRSISTIHCRCSPSQFDEVVETVGYELKPLESIDAKWLREKSGIDVDKLLNTERFDKLFRWPKL